MPESGGCFLFFFKFYLTNRGGGKLVKIEKMNV